MTTPATPTSVTPSAPRGGGFIAFLLIAVPIALVTLAFAAKFGYVGMSPGARVGMIFALLLAMMLTGMPISIALGLTVLTYIFTLTTLPVEAIALTSDRAGLLLAGDVAAAIGILLREDLPIGAPRPESVEAIATAVGQRRDVRELIAFALSDDFFRLRQRIGMSSG